MNELIVQQFESLIYLSIIKIINIFIILIRPQISDFYCLKSYLKKLYETMKINLPGNCALTKNGKHVNSQLSNAIRKMAICVEFQSIFSLYFLVQRFRPKIFTQLSLYNMYLKIVLQNIWNFVFWFWPKGTLTRILIH